jgi:hypothetical protein
MTAERIFMRAFPNWQNPNHHERVSSFFNSASRACFGRTISPASTTFVGSPFIPRNHCSFHQPKGINGVEPQVRRAAVDGPMIATRFKRSGHYA